MTIKTRPPLKAYQNSHFLHGNAARVIRILSEYLEPASRLRFHKVKDTVVFFGSARIQPLEETQKHLDEVRLQLQAEASAHKPTAEQIDHAEKAVKLSRY